MVYLLWRRSEGSGRQLGGRSRRSQSWLWGKPGDEKQEILNAMSIRDKRSRQAEVQDQAALVAPLRQSGCSEYYNIEEFTSYH